MGGLYNEIHGAVFCLDPENHYIDHFAEVINYNANEAGRRSPQLRKGAEEKLKCISHHMF
jgi:hypothetical protein